MGKTYTNRTVRRWLVLADDPAYEKDPPTAFVQRMGLWNASQDYCRKAWELFKKVKRPVSMAEIQQYIKEGK